MSPDAGSGPSDATAAAALAGWLPSRRWFSGKGLDFSVAGIGRLPWIDIASDDGRFRLELVTVEFRGGARDTYQVPTYYLPRIDPTLEHALIGPVDDPELGASYGYDAVHVKEATGALLEAFRAALAAPGTTTVVGGAQFHAIEGGELPGPETGGTVMTAEQSNTSVVFGDEAILKLFRRIADGQNPDIEIHEALTRAGFESVAPLLGWTRASWTDADGTRRTADLGMLQSFLLTATDGWDLALASVRDLLAEQDLHPEEVGGDFAAESERLGETVAEVHRELAGLFPTAELTVGDRDEIAGAMGSRLDAAVEAVPELAGYREQLRARLDRIRGTRRREICQRVHGDLHLGQTMRTVKGWKILDFEGEPERPLADRTHLESPLRDVAGMLRSFDYAAGATVQEFGRNPQLTYRAAEWKQRNRDAFLVGYESIAGGEIAEHADLLAAYEADKAVYEAVYEARNRPGWIEIPLRAIARIAAEE